MKNTTGNCNKRECCCKCKFQLELYKHPFNEKEIVKGSIMESTGFFVCTVANEIDKDGKGVIFDNKHGQCELFAKRKKYVR